MEWTNNKYFTVIANVCRFILSLVLVLSGFVKAVDPVGSMYKLREYVQAFSVNGLTDDWLLFIAIMQAVLEFMLGICLLMGVYRKVVAFAAPLVTLFFTVLTMIIYFAGNIQDCGCFGDAIAMTNGETLAKNIFLLVLSLAVMLGRRRFVYNISSKSRWMVTLFALAYIALAETLSLSHLPVVDFSSYPVGMNLREATKGIPDEYRVMYIYELNGDTCEFAQNEQPDSAWTCVGSRYEVVKKGIKPEVADFSIVDWEWDCDISDKIISDSGYVCLVAIELVETASVSRVDKINDLYDHCLEKNIAFYVATASDDDNIELWRKRTGAEYPMYWMDEAVIRNMIRSNPGILLLKDGIIIGKWNVADMPAVEELADSSARVPDSFRTHVDWMRGWQFWMILLAAPLLFIIVLDVIVCRVSKKNPTDEAVKEGVPAQGAETAELKETNTEELKDK